MRYLLIINDCYYPSFGTDDWVKTFDSIEEIEKCISKKETFEYFQRGKRKGEIKSSSFDTFYLDKKIDDYTIVDLQEWIDKEE